jgi:hypothetical protein
MKMEYVTELASWQMASLDARSEFIELIRTAGLTAQSTALAWCWFITGWTRHAQNVAAAVAR